MDDDEPDTRVHREPVHQCRISGVQLLAGFGVNDAQHRFRLRQIEPASEKRAERELAGARQPCASLRKHFERRV